MVDGGPSGEGVVEAVETWREGLEGLRAAEAREFTARVEARMQGHGGRARWARLVVCLDDGRVTTVEAPQFVIVESRATVDHRGEQLQVEHGTTFDDRTTTGRGGGAAGGRG
jgi:RNase H-fold protein (predicted Holliday junction resolvase)